MQQKYTAIVVLNNAELSILCTTVVSDGAEDGNFASPGVVTYDKTKIRG